MVGYAAQPSQHRGLTTASVQRVAWGLAEPLLGARRCSRTQRTHQEALVASRRSQDLIVTEVPIYPAEDAASTFWVRSASFDL